MELPQAMAGSFFDISGPQLAVADAPAQNNDFPMQTSPPPEARTADPSIPDQNGTCYILRIPLELRLVIYDIALSEPTGLFCCPKTSNSKDTSTEEKNPDSDSVRKTSARPTFKMYASLEAATTPGAPEANQLKYVCRQMREETSGMGLKPNDLNFVRASMPQMSPTILFEKFLEQCTPKKQGQIRKVTMYVDRSTQAKNVDEPSQHVDIGGPDFRSWSVINAWGAAHVKATLQVRLCGLPDPTFRVRSGARMRINFSPQHTAFIVGLLCQILFCRRDLSAELPFSYARFRKWSATLRRRYPALRKNLAPNLQLWPEEQDFDEQSFRAEWSSYCMTVDKTVPFWPGGLDAMVKEAKSWYTQGLFRDFRPHVEMEESTDEA